MIATRRAALVGAFLLSSIAAATANPPRYERWRTFTVADGLPSDKVFCVVASDDEVWAGTDHGVARYHEGAWKAMKRADGLAHDAVLCVAIDPDSGDVWMGTMGGLSRWSGGRFETFDQLNSGLANNVVYGVTVHRGEVWAATASGTSRYRIGDDRWWIYDHTNTSMHEPWCYSVAGDGGKMYVAAWGGGLLEFDLARESWKRYQDPDGEMEIDLFRDDGLVHDVVSSVTVDASGRVWVATYFGLSSYDGRKWRNFLDHDSPLASNFINFVRARGDRCYIGTDKGLCVTDRENWWTYRRDPATGQGEIRFHPAGGEVQVFGTERIFPHEYVNGIGFQGDVIWVATDEGLARGELTSDNDGANEHAGR